MRADLVHLILAAGLIAGFVALSAPAAERTPQGDEGIAAKYPGDVGLARDPDVIFVEDFEKDPKVVAWQRSGGWYDLSYGPGKGCEMVATKPAAGKRCMQYNLKARKKGSGGMFHNIKGEEAVYYRYYRRFADDWVWPKGYGPHDGMLFGGAWSAPTSTDLSIYLDFWMSGETVVRIATAKQEKGYGGWGKWMRKEYGRGPNGAQGFPYNISKPDLIVPGKWHCVEFMVKMSTPGKRDGEIRLWINGKLISEYTDVPTRDANHPTIKINKVFLAPYFHPGSPRDQIHWVDQIVIARKYIGPIATKKAKPKSEKKLVSLVATRPDDPLAPHAAAIKDAERLAREGNADGAASAYEKIAAAISEKSPAAAAQIRARARGASARKTLIAAIVKGVETQGKKNVYIDFAGAGLRAKIVKATREEGTFRLKGSELPIAWSRMAPHRLGAIAAKYAGKGADHLVIARFLLACGEKSTAGKVLDKARELGLTGDDLAAAKALDLAVR